MESKITTIEDITQNIISENRTLLDALEQLDRVSVKVLFVVEKEVFVATVTDGDVRRAILAGASLETAVVHIANYHPFYIQSDNKETAERYLEEITALPVINKNKKILKVYVRNASEQQEYGEKLNIPVVIMAGGLGTRLYPYTKILPKPLIPVADVPIVERIVQIFQKTGSEEIYMIVNYKKNMIKAYFSDSAYNINFCDEDKPLGTGGGLRLLEDDINDTFILTNCDILVLEDVRKIVKHHKEKGNKVTMVCSLKNFEIPYGVVNFTEGGEISSFEEKPKMSFFANTGYYILETDIFRYIEKEEKIDMPDLIDRMRSKGEKIGMYPIGENAWLDMGEFSARANMEGTIMEANIIS